MELDMMAVDMPVIQDMPEVAGWIPIGRGGWLPWIIVVPVQLAAVVWEFGVIAMIMSPFWIVLTAIATIDWFLDWVFLLTLGLFCKPCAGIFIWIINIAMLPLVLLGWLQKAFLDTFGLIIHGWMLLFNFSGCYLFIGHHCWRKSPDKTFRTKWDIPLLISGGKSLRDVLTDFMTPPDITSRD